ncbi:hypothetical protein SAMN02745784_02996 [Tissierella praeacuta DSM 18095]|uniref:Uncharacterized protein n=1 Tax=Tissierella praeacuta DSM 18095 TaxID=1123404 RepID=A0A1M4ZC49_9FIRM|nr:hypothetical protein [Tissierella praeacuta]TCU74228.1 hypothetical protein EV204_104266 [Tissierella praeacuta]SHF15545.1 hypothetical protein SAMN02745784_02996 [Tissierella praeacuta DSM 18095]SUO99566.1 Uncharacterised protein [Tissierella praeacuta]
MSKITDISAKLTNERPKLKLAEDKIYDVDDRKNTIILLNQKMEKLDMNDINAIDEMISVVLGEDAAKEINDMNLSIMAYQSIMIAIMAAVTGEKYEVMEARFRREEGI